MFEHALLDSAATIRSSKSWTTTVSLAFQGAILVAVILFVKFNPQALSPSHVDLSLARPTITPPPKLTPAPKLPRVPTSSGANELPATAPSIALINVAAPADGPAPSTNLAAFTKSIGNAAPNPAAATAPAPAVAASKASGPIRISSGAVQANCTSCPPPLYPAPAKAVHVSGSVVLDALISISGAVENLRVLSGPPLLRTAALEAARNWRFKPTILSGQPVEVEAEITVAFHLD